MPTAIAPGESVLSYCKTCKKVGEHTVAAVRGARPYRVQCATCEETHEYQAGPAKPKKKGAHAASRGATLSGDGSYESLVAGRDLTQVLTYGMGFRYASADLIEHATFGVGLVTRVLFNHKIEVVFPAGTKTLVHER